MTTEYRILPEGIKDIQMRSLWIVIPAMLVGAAGGIFTATWNDSDPQMNVILFVLGLLFIFFGIRLKYRLKRQRTLLTSYRIILSDAVIKRTQLQTPEIIVPWEDITAIEQRKRCFVVKGKQQTDQIIIPLQMERLDQLLEILQAVHPVKAVATNKWKIAGYVLWLLAMSVAIVLTFTNDHKVVVTVGGLTAAATLFYFCYKLLKSKHIDVKAKRRQWIMWVLIGAIIIQVVSKWVA